MPGKDTRVHSGNFPHNGFSSWKFGKRENSHTQSAFRIMGKKRKRPAKDLESASSGVQLPSFDESALSALTSKIESGFRNVVAPKQDLRDRNPSQDEDSGYRIGKSQESRSYTKDRMSGKKSDAQGIVRAQTGSGSRTAKIEGYGHSRQIGEEQKILLQEILALGGTEDDLDLVMGVATDEDDTGNAGLEKSSATDPKLTKELSKLITSLGIETRNIGESSGAESGEDVYDESEDIPETFTSKPINTLKNVKSSDLRGANNSVRRLKDLVSKSPL
jgi:ribosome biogenesis protein MAK21